MLDILSHGPVTELRLTSTILGQPIYAVSAFYFDGVLCDTGPPRTGRELAAWAEDETIERIVNTHRHEDHVGGNAYLPSLPALAPAGALPIIHRPPRLPLYRRIPFGQPRPAHAEPLGETVSTRSHTLKVIPTPGHAPDHVALFLPEEGWLFGGDLYLMERAKYVRRADDVAQWLRSLRAILAYDFDLLFCAHGGTIPHAKTAIRRKIAYWEEIGEKARAMAAQGRRPKDIRDALLGKEGFLTYWSRGRFAKLNLIEQLLALERME